MLPLRRATGLAQLLASHRGAGLTCVHELSACLSPSPTSEPGPQDGPGCSARNVPTWSGSGSQQQFRGMAFWGWGKKAAPPSAAAAGLTEEPSWGEDSEPASSQQQSTQEINSPAPDASVIADGQESFSTAADAISEACSSVEVAALAFAKEESMWSAAQFISGIQTLHESSGMPWWASIVAINIAARLVTLPIMLASQRATGKMARLQLELLPVKKLQEAMTLAPTVEHQRAIHSAWIAQSDDVKVRLGPDIAKIMGTMFGTILCNGFVFISIFNGVTNLMACKAPSLLTGGMYWFTDLTVSDPYYGLPVLCTVSTLAMVQYGMSITGDQLAASPEKAAQAMRMKNIFRGMALLFLPLGAYVPAGVALLWASNSLFSVVLGGALRQDPVRRMVGLATMKELSELADKMHVLTMADPMTFAPPAPTPPAAESTGDTSQEAAKPPPPGSPPQPL